AVADGRLFERGARIGDRDEPRRRLRLAERGRGAIPEILLEDIGLERAAGLAGDDEQRAFQVDRAFDTADLRRVGRVEYLQSGKTGLGAESLGENFRPEARPAHTEQYRVAEPGALDLGGKRLQLANRLQLRIGDVEPAEPLRLVGF